MDTSTQPKTPESFTPVYLTEVEREVLEKLGWSPGDPVPKTLVEHLETLPEGDISQGVLINLKSELAAAKAREEMAQRTQADAPEQPAAGAMDALSQLRCGTVERIDIEPESENEKGSESPQAEDPQPLPGTSTAGDGAALPKRCPRCDWDLTLADTVPVSDDDRRAFLACFLGGEPFRKVYALAGGKMQVELQELTPKEVDLVHQQLFLERRAGKHLTEFDSLEALMRYRLVLQLKALRSEALHYTLPRSVEGWVELVGKPAEEETVLAKAYAFILDKVIRSESFFSALARLGTEFNRLLSKLSAEVFRPDF